MAKILGTELRKQFEAGFLTSTSNRISRFTPEESAIPFGQILVYGSSIGHYDLADAAFVTAARADQVVGVSMYSQAKTGTTYPGGITEIPFGEYGDVLIAGDVVVEVSQYVADEADIVEGARVYLAQDGKVTPDASHGDPAVNHLLLPQFQFLGQVEIGADGTVLAAVRKLY